MQLLKPEINCAICKQPVALETAVTDEDGQAVHAACYFLRGGITADSVRDKIRIVRRR